MKDFILEIVSDLVKAAPNQLHPLQHVLRRFCSHVAQKRFMKKGHRVTIRQVRQTDLLEIVWFWTKGCAIARQVFFYLVMPGFATLDMNMK